MLERIQLLTLNRWLFATGCKAESVDVLSRLLDLPPDSSEVQEIESQMQAAWDLEQQNGKFKWSSLWREKSEIKKTRRLVLCFLIYFFQMFTGINVIAFYGKEACDLMALAQALTVFPL